VLLWVLVLVPVGWVLLPVNLQNRFWTIIDPSVGPKNAQVSAEGRIQGLFDGIKLWESQPLLGYGPGAHGLATGHGFQPHSLYGQVLGETGTLGTIAFLGILAGFFVNNWEARRLASREGATANLFPAKLSSAIVVSVLLLLFKGYSDHNLYRYTWLWF